MKVIAAHNNNELDAAPRLLLIDAELVSAIRAGFSDDIMQITMALDSLRNFPYESIDT